MGEKDEKNFDPLTPPPSRPLGAGPSICHSSLVTLGGGGSRGGLAQGHGVGLLAAPTGLSPLCLRLVS